jgi:hypothetical protein
VRTRHGQLLAELIRLETIDTYLTLASTTSPKISDGKRKMGSAAVALPGILG